MQNSFTFKNPKQIQCFHSIITEEEKLKDPNSKETSVVILHYKHWHWAYEFERKRLEVNFHTNSTKWLNNLQPDDFTLVVQSSIYHYNPQRSVKRKPVFDRIYVDWNSNSPNCLTFKITKRATYTLFEFDEPVQGLRGDNVMLIYQTMQGFWKDFRTNLKTLKSFDIVEVNKIIKSMSGRLISVNGDTAHVNSNGVVTLFETKKESSRFSILQPVNDIDHEMLIDNLPF